MNAFPGENISDKPPGDILLTPGNFSIGGGFKGDKFKYFNGESPEDYVLHDGDLVVTMTDLSKQADTLGYPAIVPKPHGPRFLNNQRLGKLVIKDCAELDKGFLFYLLCTAEYRHEVLASSTGTTVKHTSPSRILSHKAAIPPPNEQRAIALILGSLDDKIELNRKMNETLEAMARALFKSWFVDFDPVRAKSEGRDTGLPTHVAALFPNSFEESELGEIPKGWSIEPIGDLAEAVGGSTPSTKEADYWSPETNAWATPKDLSALQSPVLLKTERRISEQGLAQIGSGLLPVGTVLMSSRAPIGYLAITQIPVAINQGFIAMKPKENASNLFLLYWAECSQETIKSRSNGSTFLEISKSRCLVPEFDGLDSV